MPTSSPVTRPAALAAAPVLPTGARTTRAAGATVAPCRPGVEQLAEVGLVDRHAAHGRRAGSLEDLVVNTYGEGREDEAAIAWSKKHPQYDFKKS